MVYLFLLSLRFFSWNIYSHWCRNYLFLLMFSKMPNYCFNAIWYVLLLRKAYFIANITGFCNYQNCWNWLVGASKQQTDPRCVISFKFVFRRYATWHVLEKPNFSHSGPSAKISRCNEILIKKVSQGFQMGSKRALGPKRPY